MDTVLMIEWRTLAALCIATLLLTVFAAGCLFVQMAWTWITRVSLSRGEEAAVPNLTCGCPDDGRPVASCIYCDDSRCMRHQDAHDHFAEELDDEMAVAKAAGMNDFGAWEAECSKLQRLADKLGSRP